MRHRKQRPTVLFAGLTYKEDVDDLRESPALHVAQAFQNNPTIDVLIAEPHVTPAVIRTKLRGGEIVSFAQGIDRADIIVILVGHTLFDQTLSVEQVTGKTVLDYCGLWYRKISENAMREWDSSASLKKLKSFSSEICK